MDSGSFFDVVTEVFQSWDRLKRLPNYESEFGKALFQKMFELSPENNWDTFSFMKDYNKTDNDMLHDPDFLKHASNFVRMLDLAIHMLGPDMDLVEEALQEVGQKHLKYGVMPEHYPMMGKALLYTLNKLLGKSFTPKCRDSWKRGTQKSRLTQW